MKARLIVCIALLVMSVGCLPESAQMQDFSENVVQLSAKVDALQETTAEVIGTLADVNLVNAELVGKVDEANEEIDRVQLQGISIAEAIRDADYATGDDIGNVIKAAKAGAAATAPWNPYATMIIIGLTLLEGITAIFLKRKSTESTANANLRQADKEGREKTLREIAALPKDALTAPGIKSLMYTNIGDARRAIT